MWIHFNLLCDGKTQYRLHKVFRVKIKEWERQKLVEGAVLTFHFGNPNVPDSLYLCLNMPTVNTPQQRSAQLSARVIEQIPQEVRRTIQEVCRQNQVRLEIIDYELSIQIAKANSESRGVPYYGGASAEDVLRFASAGTRVALQILDLLGSGQRPWSSDKELASFILSELKKELGEHCPWLRQSFHFVCNPLRIPSPHEEKLWSLASI